MTAAAAPPPRTRYTHLQKLAAEETNDRTVGRAPSGPGAAGARAGEGSELVAVDRDRFTRLVARTPYFALQVMSILAARLRRHMADGN